MFALGFAIAWRAAVVAFRDAPMPALTAELAVHDDSRGDANAGVGQERRIDSILALNPFDEHQAIAGQGVAQRSGMPGAFIAQGNQPLPRLAAIAGPPWSAVVSFDGGAVMMPVSVRDSVRGFRVVAIARDYVVLRSRDSTYRVTLTASRQ